jgi:hypothetical protein
MALNPNEARTNRFSPHQPLPRQAAFLMLESHLRKGNKPIRCKFITSELMTSMDSVSKAQLAALIAYLHDKPCALCRIVYHSHRAANHLFCEADEDIPIDE